MTDAKPPGSSDTLTPEQQAQAQKWLNEHWTTQACPFHGPTRWQLNIQMTSTPVYTPGRTVLGGSVFPFLVVVCAICGYTVFVSALVVGVLPTPTKPESPDTEKAAG